MRALFVIIAGLLLTVQAQVMLPHRRAISASPSGSPWLALTAMPEPKEQHGMEECGGLLYVVAGIGSYNAETNTVFSYNPATDTWTQRSNYPIKVQSLGLRAVGGKLYGMSGVINSNTYFTNVYEYDPSGGSWTAKAPIPVPIEDFATCVISNKIYVVGGITNYPPYALSKFVQVYDPSANTWTTNFTSPPEPRALGDMGVSDGTNLWFVGGSPNLTNYPSPLNANLRVDVYHPGTDTWEQKANMGLETCYKECEWLNGYIYTMAGATADTTTYTSQHQRYDIANNIWTNKSDVPYAARGIAMAQYNGLLYMSGGYLGYWTNALYRYNPALDTTLTNENVFVANTAVFDGSNDYMRMTNSAPTGLADTKTFTFSCWVNFAGGDGSLQCLFTFTDGTPNTRLQVFKNAANQILAFARNSANTAILNINTTNTLKSTNGWTHVYVCCDMSDSAKRKIYFNGVSQALTVTTYSNDTIDVVGNGFRYTVSGAEDTPATLQINGALAEFWFDDIYLDSPSSFASGGHPIYLGMNGQLVNGQAPVFYLRGSGNNFRLNTAQDGSFALFGSLGTTTPP